MKCCVFFAACRVATIRPCWPCSTAMTSTLLVGQFRLFSGARQIVQSRIDPSLNARLTRRVAPALRHPQRFHNFGILAAGRCLQQNPCSRYQPRRAFSLADKTLQILHFVFRQIHHVPCFTHHRTPSSNRIILGVKHKSHPETERCFSSSASDGSTKSIQTNRSIHVD